MALKVSSPILLMTAVTLVLSRTSSWTLISGTAEAAAIKAVKVPNAEVFILINQIFTLSIIIESFPETLYSPSLNFNSHYLAKDGNFALSCETCATLPSNPG